MTVIVAAVGDVEPHLGCGDVRAAVEGMGLSVAQLQRLARTLQRDGSVLTGPAGSDCNANIEPLIVCLRRLGAKRVRAPLCAVCDRNDSETYSRKLNKRICRACSLQGWQSAIGECASCAAVDKLIYRPRHGDGLLCRRCKPEPDVDHAAKVRDGIAHLRTGLSATEIDRVASVFGTAVAQRELNWILHDSPGVFSGEVPHRSAVSVRLAERLVAAGAHNVRTPECPLCFRTAKLGSQIDGLRCCRTCWGHRYSCGNCDRCGRRRHLINYHGAGERLCTACFEKDPLNHEPCTQCGRVGFINHHDGEVKLCRRCYRAPTAVCSSCGRTRQCDRVRAGTPICGTCATKERPPQTCSVCGSIRPVHTRSEAGEPVCAPCGRRREPCARCGKNLAVSARVAGVGPLCSGCLKREPAYFTDCVQCGTHGRAYHRGLCPACACPGALRELFAKDGELSGAANQIVAALLQCDAVPVLRWVRHTRSRSELPAQLAELGDTLSHHDLDTLPVSKSVEWLRNILANAEVLPPRDPYLHRTEQYIAARLATIVNRDDRVAVRAFAEWNHLRKLRARADQGPLNRNHGLRAQTMTAAIAEFVSELNANGLALASCRQAFVDDWLVRNPTRCQIHQFLAWAVQRGYAHDVQAPVPQTRRTRHTLPDNERWRLIQHLIEHPDLEARDRVAGLLVLLYSQPTARLVTLKVADVTITDDAVRLKLGTVPIAVPSPVDRLVADLVHQRHGHAAVTVGTNPWLFPGGRSGGHLSSNQVALRLKRIGIYPRLARNTALIDLAGELPAVVLAKLLGFSVKRAVTWSEEAGNTRPRYAAEVARRNTR
ncbi:MAG: hypothetical protein WBH51_10340 [Mycolicibacter algericus]|uniref:hypothetical protein n=1 Tax=Mycolicibacter algericus TaxID=1288388 RepID=UPI003C73555D